MDIVTQERHGNYKASFRTERRSNAAELLHYLYHLIKSF